MQTALAQRSAVAPLSAARRSSRPAAQAARASARPLWLPNTKAPAHLNGKLAGDRGFDPLVSSLVVAIGEVVVARCLLHAWGETERL